LIIEIDDGQHCEDERDKIRDKWLESQGFKVLRFWNNEVLSNIEGVVEIIKKNLFSSLFEPPVNVERKS